jgi:hypothetical protein
LTRVGNRKTEAGKPDIFTMCQHFVSASARHNISESNEWCCGNIENTTSCQENAIAEIGERIAMVHDFRSIRLGNTGIAAVFNDVAATDIGSAGAARTVDNNVAVAVTVDVAVINSVHTGVKTAGGTNTADH